MILGLLVAITVIGWNWINLRLPFPYIFADETGFVIPARMVADPGYSPEGGGLASALRSQSPVHSVLFSVVFRSGDGFFAHAKFINALLCGAMLLPAYLLARRVTGAGAALAFTALVALNPWNSLTAHFMPESLYACLFWWLAWAVLASLPEEGEAAPRPLGAALGCGLLGIVLFFTKPHALVPLAACGGVFVLRSLRTALARAPGWWLGLTQALVFGGTVLGGLWGFASAAHRPLGDVLFAGRYQGQAGGLFSLDNFAVKFEGFLRQASGHFGHSAVLYAIPLAIGITVAWRALRPKRSGEERFADLTAFTAATFALTLGVTIKFACDIMLTVDPNDIHRLSERYYGFLLPLLALPFFALPEGQPRWPARVLAILLAGGAAAALIFQWHWFRIHPHDAPQFYWLSALGQEGRPFAWFVWLGLGAAIVNVLLFAVFRRFDWRPFLLVAVIVCTAATIRTEQRKWVDSRSAIHFHAFAQMTRQLVGAEWRQTIVVGDWGIVSCYLFLLDGLPATVLVGPNDPLPADRVPPGTRWIIRVQDHPLPEGLRTESVFSYRGNGSLDISRLLP